MYRLLYYVILYGAWDLMYMENKVMNIVLIGMPGSGKSTIGVVLAKHLGYTFVDSDIVIQERHKKLLCELIDEFGEEGFLKIENEVNKSLDVDRTVIATGGSAVYSEESMLCLKKNSIFVYLKVNNTELDNRVTDLKERGVVTNGKKTMQEIFDDRSRLYEKYADVTIDEDEFSAISVPKIVDEIEELVRRCADSRNIEL